MFLIVEIYKQHLKYLHYYKHPGSVILVLDTGQFLLKIPIRSYTSQFGIRTIQFRKIQAGYLSEIAKYGFYVFVFIRILWVGMFGYVCVSYTINLSPQYTPALLLLYTLYHS